MIRLVALIALMSAGAAQASIDPQQRTLTVAALAATDKAPAPTMAAVLRGVLADDAKRAELPTLSAPNARSE